MAASQPFQPYTITRRACGPDDVVIDVKYAGICHSDIHQVREEWGPAIFPMVPGHEVGGKVAQVGANVTAFKVGDTAGVGCMVDSCRSCANCRKGEEQYCFTGMTGTYNSKYKYPHSAEYNEDGGAPTYGGYSQKIVVDKNYVLKIPDNLDLAAATPLLCAGITVYSPMMHYGLRSNMKFGVIGLGGLGHMAAKFGVGFGCHTTIISRGTAKKEGALNDLKVDAYLDSKNAEEMKAAAGSLDFILCTAAADYDLNEYVSLLGHDGKFVVVGVPSSPRPLFMFPLIGRRVQLGGSLIGGIQETQEMLDFCGKKNIVCDIEMVNGTQIDDAYKRTVAGDVKYRFVIDTSTF